jgi:hypothetical protein
VASAAGRGRHPERGGCRGRVPQTVGHQLGLLGSVSAGTVHHSHRPVLVVPPHHEAAPAGKPEGPILIGYDGSDAARAGGEERGRPAPSPPGGGRDRWGGRPRRGAWGLSQAFAGPGRPRPGSRSRRKPTPPPLLRAPGWPGHRARGRASHRVLPRKRAADAMQGSLRACGRSDCGRHPGALFSYGHASWQCLAGSHSPLTGTGARRSAGAALSLSPRRVSAARRRHGYP